MFKSIKTNEGAGDAFTNAQSVWLPNLEFTITNWTMLQFEIDGKKVTSHGKVASKPAFETSIGENLSVKMLTKTTDFVDGNGATHYYKAHGIGDYISKTFADAKAAHPDTPPTNEEVMSKVVADLQGKALVVKRKTVTRCAKDGSRYPHDVVDVFVTTDTIDPFFTEGA